MPIKSFNIFLIPDIFAILANSFDPHDIPLATDFSSLSTRLVCVQDYYLKRVNECISRTCPLITCIKTHVAYMCYHLLSVLMIDRESPINLYLLV